MKFTLTVIVAVCLAIALKDDDLLGSIAEALGFAVMLFGVIKFGQKSKKSSRYMLQRLKPDHYDKVL